MKENQASFTAIMVVYIRAYQTKHETSKIFGDFLAHHLMLEGKITDLTIFDSLG
jgi:O-methyltransferase involved in polyketide biosynthesis